MSIWGKGDKLTLEVLGKLPLKGNWLDLAAGDGRYVPELLEKVDKLVAVDVDSGMLETLQKNASKDNHELKTRVFDLVKNFPLESQSFDGVFCTGTLHLFPKDVLEKIFREIDRILKSNGMLIFDFAVDYQRFSVNGEVTKIEADQNYNMKDAEKFIQEQLKDYDVKIYRDEWEGDLTKNPNFGYKTIGKYLLVVANKK